MDEVSLKIKNKTKKQKTIFIIHIFVNERYKRYLRE